VAGLRLRRRASFLGIAPVLAVVTALFALQAAPSAATTGSASSGSVGHARAGDAAARVVGSLSVPLAKTHAHFLYAQDGTCPDGIDVFKLSGTTLSHIQTVKKVGCPVSTWFGSHHLAVVTTPTDCLIYADQQDGYVRSFKIDAKTGKLSTTPTTTANVGGGPSDLAVSGSTVFESDPNNFIDVFTVGAGCHLGIDSQNSTEGERDIDIAAINPTTVVSADYDSSLIVVYTLQSDGKFAETTRDSSQIFDPQGVALYTSSNGLNVFTGQATDVQPQTQGFKVKRGVFTPLKHSPQISSDESSSNGAAVTVSKANHLLAQADQGSGQIGWDNWSAGGMSYTGDTPLAHKYEPSELTILGNDLFVAQVEDGDVEACTLAPNKVSHCHSVVKLTGASLSNQGGSTAIFTQP
jgi:hypothetical protein